MMGLVELLLLLICLFLFALLVLTGVVLLTSSTYPKIETLPGEEAFEDAKTGTGRDVSQYKGLSSHQDIVCLILLSNTISFVPGSFMGSCRVYLNEMPICRLDCCPSDIR